MLNSSTEIYGWNDSSPTFRKEPTTTSERLMSKQSCWKQHNDAKIDFAKQLRHYGELLKHGRFRITVTAPKRDI